MKRLLSITTLLVASLVCGISAGVEARSTGTPHSHVSQRLVCKDANFEVISPCRLGYETGRAHGRLRYYTPSAGGEETMLLVLHGLEPDTWYLATFQDPTGRNQFSTNGATCLFGVKGTGTRLEFCDVALVQTDRWGKVRTLIPTDTGLTGAPSPICADGNVPGLTPRPNMGHGSYTGLTMIVKNVGISLDGTTPDCAALRTGGTAELFDLDTLPAFEAP